MDRKSGRLAVYSLAFISFLTLSLAAQPEGYIEVPRLRTFPGGGFGCYIPSGNYDEEKLRAVLQRPNCAKETRGLKVDLQKETLIRYNVGSDCHMRVETRVFRIDAEKRYEAIINNIYGGCRAGGWRQGWIVIEKLPPGYNLDVVEVKIDRIHGPIRDEGFAYPKPPSTKRQREQSKIM